MNPKRLLNKLSAVWHYEPQFMNRWCGGAITVGDICKAGLTGVGFAMVLMLIGMVMIVIAVIYMPYC